MAITHPLGAYTQYYDTLLYRVRPGDTLPGILCSANSARQMPTLSPATLSVL